MQQATQSPYAGPVAAEAPLEARNKFIEKTYLHLALAIAAFVGLEAVLVNVTAITQYVPLMLEGYNWLAVLGAFIVVSWIADRWARSSTSLGMQYAGLALYVVAEALIFVPLVFIARAEIGVEAIMTAGGVTLAIFAALTLYVFVTKKDFSFMRGILSTIAMGAFGLIIASIFLGFSLGMVFVVGMIILAAGYILYYTSNILHHYRPGQHVAAALALFSAVALLFWYVLRIFMSRR